MTKTYRGWAVLPLALAVACAQPAPPAEDAGEADAARAAIDAGHQAFLTAMRANDTGGLIALTTADVIFMPPNMPPLVGQNAIRTWYDGILTQFRTADVTVADREVVVTGDWGIERGSFTWTVTPVAGGDPVVDRGNFIAIWQRQPDGSWAIQRDIWNSAQPLPGAEAAR